MIVVPHRAGAPGDQRQVDLVPLSSLRNLVPVPRPSLGAGATSGRTPLTGTGQPQAAAPAWSTKTFAGA